MVTLVLIPVCCQVNRYLLWCALSRARVTMASPGQGQHFEILYCCSDGSPGGQAVDQRWEVDWASYLVSKRSFVVVKV